MPASIHNTDMQSQMAHNYFQLWDNQTAFDCPDVTAVVFKSRLDQLKMNLRNGKYSDGHELTYSFHVIEYQYSRLPHAHLVARLKDAPDTTDQNQEDLINLVDSHFVAELPCFKAEEHYLINKICKKLIKGQRVIHLTRGTFHLPT